MLGLYTRITASHGASDAPLTLSRAGVLWYVYIGVTGRPATYTLTEEDTDMNIDEATVIVIELARQNQLDEKEAQEDPEVLAPIREQQEEAINTVYGYLGSISIAVSVLSEVREYLSVEHVRLIDDYMPLLSEVSGLLPRPIVPELLETARCHRLLLLDIINGTDGLVAFAQQELPEVEATIAKAEGKADGIKRNLTLAEVMELDRTLPKEDAVRLCPKCQLPMSQCSEPEWVCDGPNANTRSQGCQHLAWP